MLLLWTGQGEARFIAEAQDSLRFVLGKTAKSSWTRFIYPLITGDQRMRFPKSLNTNGLRLPFSHPVSNAWTPDALSTTPLSVKNCDLRCHPVIH
jgi:hypothetical protein